MDGVILASPDHYRIEYSINPLTDKRSVVNAPIAARQFAALKARYEAHGIPVHVIDARVADPAAEFPDFTFVSNSALILRGWPTRVAILSRYAKPERQGEERRVAAYLEHILGYRVIELPEKEGLYFEGQGDARWSHDGTHLWISYGTGRTTLAGITAIEEILLREATAAGIEPPTVHRLHQVQKTTYHLDQAFCPLPNGRVLFHASSFSAPSRHLIEHTFGKANLVPVPIKYLYACNAVWLPDGTLVIPKLDGTGKVRRWMYKATGMHIEESNQGQFQLAGGSVSCLTLPMWSLRPPLRTQQ